MSGTFYSGPEKAEAWEGGVARWLSGMETPMSHEVRKEDTGSFFQWNYSFHYVFHFHFPPNNSSWLSPLHLPKRSYSLTFSLLYPQWTRTPVSFFCFSLLVSFSLFKAWDQQLGRHLVMILLAESYGFDVGHFPKRQQLVAPVRILPTVREAHEMHWLLFHTEKVWKHPCC